MSKKKGIAKFTAFCLAAGLTFGEGGMVLLAATPDRALVGLSSTSVKVSAPAEVIEGKKRETVADKALVGLGSTSVKAEVKAEEVEEETAEVSAENMEAAAETAEAAPAADENMEIPEGSAEDVSVEEEPKVLDTSMVGTTGFAMCENYVNVRSASGADSEALGKIYNNGSMEILDVAPNGWYYVRSGNLEGYVSPDFVAIGEQAEEIASVSGYTTAQVATDALNVRADASADAELMATIDGSHSMEVVSNEGDWVKVLVDGEMYGYVSADYVTTTTEYATGETAEEEQERLDQEWLAYLAEQEAAQAAAEAEWLAYVASQQTVSYSAPSTSASTGSLETDCQNAYAAYVSAQDAADSAVANGADEQTIMDTAAAAQSAYGTYVALQNQVDEAAANATAESYSAPASQSADYTTQAAVTTGNLEADCQAAYAAYVSAQNAADSAVANGADEQTVMDTAAAAQSAYGTYVELQNKVDNAAVEQANAAYTQSTETTQTTQTSTEQAAPAASAAPAEAPAASSAGQSIANFACQFVGNPYVWGGSSLTSGADCSGFTMAVMANFGISLPHNAAAQSGYGTPVSMDSLQPGDLLFYNGSGGIGHVSMYIGNGQVVHASNPSSGIKISSVGYRTPCAARRFV